MFKHIPQNQGLVREQKIREQMQTKQREVELASSIVFVKLCEMGKIDPITAREHMDLFNPWTQGVDYEEGAMRVFEGELYRCTSAHTSKNTNSPIAMTKSCKWETVATLGGGNNSWSEPIGIKDSYSEGDVVVYKGKSYQSLTDNNVDNPVTTKSWEEIRVEE